ncbi:MAG: hypothetical protein OEW12_06775 [Deltaproteobacteria bacterium]|nr:hypothetical protein [Deltaproteobacteria bacterium]
MAKSIQTRISEVRQNMPDEPPYIFKLQVLLGTSFVAFATSVIIWVGRLLYMSFFLKDKQSASMGIALVAIPVFLVLVGVYNYVFWGIMLGGRKK